VDWSFLANLNPDSLQTVQGAKLEPHWRPSEDSAYEEAVRDLYPDGIYRVQFERHGYFCVDSTLSKERPVFNRTVALRDSWSKGK